MELPASPSFRLDGRRALVTGASSGIGLGAAVALARAGAAVTMAARGAERLHAAVAALRAEGLDATALVLDIADTAATARAVAAGGPFRVLVNAAGLARHAPALDTTPQDFDAVAGVNLRGACFLAQAVARGLVAAGQGGSIVQVSSQMGHVGGPERAVYCATKHGLEGMTKAMALEWAPHGIRVNTICPTFLRTPLTERSFADPARRAWIEGRIPLGRVGQVSDVMGAVVYLASDASALVTGSALMLDGGWTAQ